MNIYRTDYIFINYNHFLFIEILLYINRHCLLNTETTNKYFFFNFLIFLDLSDQTNKLDFIMNYSYYY